MIIDYIKKNYIIISFIIILIVIIYFNLNINQTDETFNNDNDCKNYAEGACNSDFTCPEKCKIKYSNKEKNLCICVDKPKE